MIIEKKYLINAKNNSNNGNITNEALYPIVMEKFLFELKENCPKYNVFIVGYIRRFCKKTLNNDIWKHIAHYSL